jgi:hypothetical protein
MINNGERQSCAEHILAVHMPSCYEHIPGDHMPSCDQPHHLARQRHPDEHSRHRPCQK